jgi:hypothetical protein
MPRSVLPGVAAGVFVLRRVAAPHLSIGHAHAQVDPGITQLDASLTASGGRRNILDLIKVQALPSWLSADPLEGKANGLQQSHAPVSCLDRSLFSDHSLLPGAVVRTPAPAG